MESLGDERCLRVARRARLGASPKFERRLMCFRLRRNCQRLATVIAKVRTSLGKGLPQCDLDLLLLNGGPCDGQSR